MVCCNRKAKVKMKIATWSNVHHQANQKKDKERRKDKQKRKFLKQKMPNLIKRCTEKNLNECILQGEYFTRKLHKDLVNYMLELYEEIKNMR